MSTALNPRFPSTEEDQIQAIFVGTDWASDCPDLRDLASKNVRLLGPFAGPVAQAAREETPTVVVVGSKADRRRALRIAREAGGRTPSPAPVLACVAREDLVAGVSLKDVDDFCVVPTCAAELSARMRRLVGSMDAGGKSAIVAGDIALDPTRYVVTISGRRVTLSWKEFQLLQYLMKNDGRVMGRREIMLAVWGAGTLSEERTVDVHIQRLRRKLAPASLIRTVKNVGYGLHIDGAA